MDNLMMKADETNVRWLRRILATNWMARTLVSSIPIGSSGEKAIRSCESNGNSTSIDRHTMKTPCLLPRRIKHHDRNWLIKHRTHHNWHIFHFYQVFEWKHRLYWFSALFLVSIFIHQHYNLPIVYSGHSLMRETLKSLWGRDETNFC